MRKGGEVGMTVKEAILTLNANAVIACERAGFSSATVKMIEDALDTIEDALKAQEPRVMTLEELFCSENAPVYLERKLRKCQSEICPAIVSKTVKGYVLGDVYHMIRKNKISEIWFGNEYNKRWRCWNNKPTEEQRIEAKWYE